MLTSKDLFKLAESLNAYIDVETPQADALIESASERSLVPGSVITLVFITKISKFHRRVPYLAKNGDSWNHFPWALVAIGESIYSIMLYP